MTRPAPKVSPRAPAMGDLPVRRMQHAMMKPPPSSAGTSLRSSSRTLGVSATVEALREPLSGSANERSLEASLYDELVSIERALTS